jgi:phytoene dehydrogenase-like protein
LQHWNPDLGIRVLTLELSGQHFDALIIGCGMSGLAAGIRLAMYDRKVLIVEKHNAPGGLNGFYSRNGRKFDVGLHAVTNFVPPGAKGAPLTKLCRQLRIPHEAFELSPQLGSRISFPGVDLRFSNDLALLESEIADRFPASIDGFRKLVAEVRAWNAYDLTLAPESTRARLTGFIPDPELIEMLLCPLMYYGSARENDMDWDQFVIMFQSLFLEGFARPLEGVRVIIRQLLKRFRECGGLRRMKCGVKKLIPQGNRIQKVILEDGTELTADHIISSIGSVETAQLWTHEPLENTVFSTENTGRLSFVESIAVLKQQPSEWDVKDTIVFFSRQWPFTYRQPRELIDPNSGVICFPGNYAYTAQQSLSEGMLRVTTMANYHQWKALDTNGYAHEKNVAFHQLMGLASAIVPQLPTHETLMDQIAFSDLFTPLTITRFTSHRNGAIYGASTKQKNGQTPFENLYLCGTDQGFLGIIGSLLSGISMANLHVLQAR